MPVTGKCLCGAVSYIVNAEKPEVGVCHCEMCRRWTGGVFVSFSAKPDEVTFGGEDKIKTRQNSPWAERAFCADCGSSLYYRVTADGPHKGEYHMGAGTRDDWDGVALNSEIYIDKKPAAYAFAGSRNTMTEAEVMAMFAPPPDGEDA